MEDNQRARKQLYWSSFLGDKFHLISSGSIPKTESICPTTTENKFVGTTNCHSGRQQAKQETADVLSCFFRRQITLPFSPAATIEVSVLFPGPVKTELVPTCQTNISSSSLYSAARFGWEGGARVIEFSGERGDFTRKCPDSTHKLFRYYLYFFLAPLLVPFSQGKPHPAFASSP